MFTLHEVQNNSTPKLARFLISNVRGVETANTVFAKSLWREKHLLPKQLVKEDGFPGWGRGIPNRWVVALASEAAVAASPADNSDAHQSLCATNSKSLEYQTGTQARCRLGKGNTTFLHFLCGK